MSRNSGHRLPTGAALTLAAAAALLLGGCSGQDADAAEKLGAMNAAAARAEAAADRAEKAAKSAESARASQTVEEEATPEEDSAQNDPNQ